MYQMSLEDFLEWEKFSENDPVEDNKEEAADWEEECLMETEEENLPSLEKIYEVGDYLRDRETSLRIRTVKPEYLVAVDGGGIAYVKERKMLLKNENDSSNEDCS